MSNTIPKLSEEELELIAYNQSIHWKRVASYIGDERRWGFDRWIIFTENSDLADKFYRFSYYEGSGDSEIDFEPTALEEVEQVSKVIQVWEPVK